MKAKARLIKIENFSGTSKKTGNAYNMEVGHFLDLDTFDKLRLNLPDAEAEILKTHVGKDGMLDLGFDPRTEKLSYANFKVAA